MIRSTEKEIRREPKEKKKSILLTRVSLFFFLFFFSPKTICESQRSGVVKTCFTFTFRVIVPTILRVAFHCFEFIIIWYLFAWVKHL